MKLVDLNGYNDDYIWVIGTFRYELKNSIDQYFNRSGDDNFNKIVSSGLQVRFWVL
jgi:hypothetical protein